MNGKQTKTEVIRRTDTLTVATPAAGTIRVQYECRGNRNRRQGNYLSKLPPRNLPRRSCDSILPYIF